MASRIYLDTSVYHRPFDDQAQPRIWLETLAVSIIFQMVESSAIELVTSTVLTYEVSRNPDENQRNWVQRVSASAAIHQDLTEELRRRAKELESRGLKALDALHVASAETAKVDYFVTCDDRLIRRYRTTPQRSLIVCGPTEFVENFSGE